MNPYTMESLQARRSQAMIDGDMPAYWAFDILIGHVLGVADMYAGENIALQRVREHLACAEVHPIDANVVLP